MVLVRVRADDGVQMVNLQLFETRNQLLVVFDLAAVNEHHELVVVNMNYRPVRYYVLGSFLVVVSLVVLSDGNTFCKDRGV